MINACEEITIKHYLYTLKCDSIIMILCFEDFNVKSLLSN